MSNDNKQITIVSDGTVAGSAVYSADGKQIDGITAVEVHINADTQLVTAVLYVLEPKINMVVNTTSVSEFTRQLE